MKDVIPTRRPSSIVNDVKEMQDKIMRRAQQIFEQSGSVPGRDIENWTQAERELMWKPALELSEKHGQIQLEVAISGVDPKDIDIQVTPEDILVRAETRHQHPEQKGTVHHCEFEFGKMFRAIHLPTKIDPDKVKAEFSNGMLRLTAQVAAEVSSKRVKPEAA